MTMSRDAAHAAIVLVLSDVPAGYRFTDVADDILDAIWPETEPHITTAGSMSSTVERRFATWNPHTKEYEAPGKPCDEFAAPPGGGYHCWCCGHEARKHKSSTEPRTEPP